jgi:hypothetical protein
MPNQGETPMTDAQSPTWLDRADDPAGRHHARANGVPTSAHQTGGRPERG